MCGVTGLWRPAGADETALRDDARRMARRLAHRGPDEESDWVDAREGMAFGFRRLAILDLSATGSQPMRSSDGRFVVAFNGEIYNFRELRHELAHGGVQFRGTSDTEVLVELVARDGVARATPKLWGMFAFAIWDVPERQLWLARDRLGKKPLYYVRGNGVWLFGSELKSLRAHTACPSAIDRDALVALLRYGCIPSPATIYAGVRKLPPGCLARLTASGDADEEPYWSARDVAGQQNGGSRPSEPEAIEELDALLGDAVARRMVSDVPLGAFLSGGIDSSAIVALMQARASRPVRTFTVGFDAANYDEAPAAETVARHLGTEHTTLRVTAADALSIIPELPSIYDEPFADSSQIPTCLVARLARRHVTVALSGDGGDEVFGGYTRHVWAERVFRRTSVVPAFVRRSASAALLRLTPAGWESLGRASDKVLYGALRQRRPAEKLQKLARLIAASDATGVHAVLTSQWHAPESIVIGGCEREAWWQQQTRAIELPTLSERLMFLDLVAYLPDDILTKVDRASMAASLEARCPLLDHRVVEWAWRLPLDFKIRASRGKWILRQLLSRYVPPALVDRPKSGFALPLADWLRGPLRDWAESLLDAGRLAREGYLHAAPLRTVWDDHLAGRRNDEHRLWPVLMFQAWLAASKADAG